MKKTIPTFWFCIVWACISCVCCTNPSAKALPSPAGYDANPANGVEKAGSPYMPTGFYYLGNGEDTIAMKIAGTGETYLISKTPFAGVADIMATTLTDTNLEKNEIYTELCMKFNEKGTQDLAAGTGNTLQARIAVVICNTLLYVVDNTSSIKTGVMCVGVEGYTPEEINTLKACVDSKR
jgi:hypothetical protein